MEGKGISGAEGLCWQRLMMLLDPLDGHSACKYSACKMRAFEANIAQGPYLGTFSASFWLVFLWLEPPGPTGSVDSPGLAESSDKCFQPTCSGVTSHFCQSFPHSLLFHSWDPLLPLVAAAQQLRWAISCTPV